MKRDNDGRPPSPGDEVDDLVASLAAGDASMFVDDDDDNSEGIGDPVEPGTPPEGETKVLFSTPAVGDSPLQRLYEEAPRPDPILNAITPSIRGALQDQALKLELDAFANFLVHRQREDLALVFHTPIGNISSSIVWCNIRAADWEDLDELILVMVRSTSASFSPEPEVEMDLSLRSHGSETPTIRAMCLARPMRMYPGAGIDLLCFLPYNDAVEKNGKLEEDAPSVVSGEPSNGVDEDGEPIKEGEKSAAVEHIPRRPVLPTEDFDKVRST